MNKDELKNKVDKMIDEKADDVEEKIRQTAETLADLTKKAKKKYHSTDDKTKIMASIITFFIMITSAIGIMRIFEKLKNYKNDD
jgi:hypothetical protein